MRDIRTIRITTSSSRAHNLLPFGLWRSPSSPFRSSPDYSPHLRRQNNNKNPQKTALFYLKDGIDNVIHVSYWQGG